MSTTESSQNSTPDAPDATTANEPPEPSAVAPAATTPAMHATNGEVATADASRETRENGEGSSASEGLDDSGEPEEGAKDPATASTDAAGEGPGEKKRRRRRRKKKPGARTGDAVEGGGAPDPTEGAVEGTAQTDVETKGQEKSDRPEKRDRKKERKYGPPRERPPVNVSDIVFGKILEITDEAILIDIPGKAHAIFDRREMLLPDDDEATPPPAAEGSTGSASDAAPAEDAETLAAEADMASEGPLAEGAEVAMEAPAPVAVAEHVAPVDALSEAGTTAEPGDAIPPKEPKVPRVILEVGADFIGVVHNDGARGGLVVLTHHPRRAERAKPHVEKAFADKTTLLGLVTGVIKGGVEVDVDGLRAFAPGSHVDLRLGADLSHLLGKRLPFFVTQYAKRGRDVVLSRKAMIEDEARRARTDALAKLKVGEDLDGIVRSVVPFGAFVDVGGIEGLVPLQEMSHNRADGPSDVFKAGEPTRVRVVKIDDKGKVWLSRRATIPDPWQEVARKYAQGTRHQGKVVRLQPFGAFVELEPGVDGLIHMSDLSVKRIETPEEVVKVGDAIEIVVSHVDPNNHKIALHPAPQGDVANETPQRVAPHKAVKAKVVTIESGGLIVRILGVTGRNARGYVTAAGTGTPRGTELRKAFHVGQEVEAKIIEMDPRRGEIKLSIKALSEELERSAYQQYRQQLKAEAKFTFGDLLAKKKN